MKTKGTETRLLCDIMLFYGLEKSKSAPAANSKSFKDYVFKNIVISEKYYFHQTRIYVFSS